MCVIEVNKDFKGGWGVFFVCFVLFIKGDKRSSTQDQEVASNSYGITITISRSSLRVLRCRHRQPEAGR